MKKIKGENFEQAKKQIFEELIKAINNAIEPKPIEKYGIEVVDGIKSNGQPEGCNCYINNNGDWITDDCIDCIEASKDYKYYDGIVRKLDEETGILEKTFSWNTTVTGTIEDYILSNVILLAADGTIDNKNRVSINELLSINNFDCVVDRNWNIHEKESINIIGYKIINLK